MEKLWNNIELLNCKVGRKNLIFLSVLLITCGTLGAVLWAVAARFVLSGAEWLFCFIGYPAFFAGLIGGILYLYRHSFT